MTCDAVRAGHEANPTPSMFIAAARHIISCPSCMAWVESRYAAIAPERQQELREQFMREFTPGIVRALATDPEVQ